MKTAYSYIRFSTPEQAKGDSLRRQVAASKEWCKANGYVLSEQSFFDSGKSASKGEHLKDGGELKKFIELVEKNIIPRGSVMLVENFDRLSRLPPVESIGLFLNIINAGIGVVFTLSYDKRVIDTNLLNKDQFVLQMVIAECIRAFSESNRKSVLIKASKQAKKDKMKSGLIVAHNNIPKYFTFDKSKGVYVHNEQTKIIVSLIEGALAGKSLYEMAKDLNARGIPTIRRKFEWSGNSIGAILRNPVLIGSYLGNKNYLPPIIDETTFYKLQNILNQNVSNRGKKAGLVNIFKGICFCASCDGRMNVGSGVYKEVPYRYLHCSNYGKKTSCKEKAYLRLDLIERDFFYNFLCKNPYELINGTDKAELKALQGKIAEMSARQNQVNDEIKKAIALLDKLDVAELEDKLTKLNGERDKLKCGIDALNAKAITIKDTPKNLDKWLVRVTRFGEGKNGEDVVNVLFRETMEGIDKALTDNKARESIRAMLPSIIGKITVDSKKRLFTVFDRMGRRLYQSDRYSSLNNNTERWRQSLKTWTKRKTAGGKVIVCKRYQRKPKKLSA